MTNKKEPKQFKDLISQVYKKIAKLYWSPLYKYLEENQDLIKTFPGFLLMSEKIVFYFGKTHLAIEYYGPERVDSLLEKRELTINFIDYTQKNCNFIEEIIGFKYDSSSDVKFPLVQNLEDLILPTNSGFDKLHELNWNLAAQNFTLGLNTGNFYIPKGKFVRLINSLFFDADEKGLKTRHIKWIDFIPVIYDDSKEESDSYKIFFIYNEKTVKQDAHYIYPLPDDNDFKYSKLPKINRFIEKIGNSETTEPEITSFLASDEYKFILSMAFLAKDIYPEVTCKWQSINRRDLKPDFFVLKANGYADIVEFKLPKLKSKVIAGKENREAFSAEINSYVAQTRVYKEYFEDPNNRKWFEEIYGFKVLKPRRILVMGRRWDFESEEWKKIVSDYKSVEIVNYDELVDGLKAQFYN